MPKEKKNYVIETADGRMSIRMLEKGTDGKIHSASCEYPFYTMEEVEKEVIDADGNKRKIFVEEPVKKTRKQTEKYLLGLMGYKA